MKIKSRIILLQAVVIGIVLMMTGVAFISHNYSDYYLRRVEWTNYQLDAITSVSLHANDFSKQIVELLLIGDARNGDYLRASKDLEADIANAQELTLNEHAFLLSMGKPSDVTDELQRFKRMNELYVEIDRAVVRLITLRKAGRMEDAEQLFRRDIERRLGAEFDDLLHASVLNEKQKVELAEHQANILWDRMIWATVLAALLALVISLVTAYKLATALRRPIRDLIAGTKAIKRGDFSRRMDYQDDDELGLLAQGFNRMAEQLEDQGKLVQSAQTNLERQVEDRTRKLARANQRLSELDRLRVQFLADISHELRTPLTALRGEAEITLRRPPDSQEVYHDVLTRIVNLTADMGRQVDDLLFLARSEAEVLRFDIRRVCLQEVIDKIAQESNVLGRGKQITLEVIAPEQPVWIDADPHRLRQALMIVTDNAIKYSPPQKAVSLTVETDDKMAHVIVRDQGYGIRDEDLAHVFDRFYRGSLDSGNGNGMGLGLAIAKRLIEKQDGDIEITSERGQYTEVRVSIPQAQEMFDDQGAAGRG